MTTTTNAGFDSAAASAAVGLINLVELDFASGTMRLTNWPCDVTAGAYTYTGLGQLAQVGEIKESEDGATQTLDLALSQVNVSNLSLALGSVGNYQGRDVRVYLALTDGTLQPVGSSVLRFAGKMDTVKIAREAGGAGIITLQCKTGGYDVRRNPAALRMNNSQHQARYPGELGFSMIADLIGRPTQWLSKRFQQV